MSTQVYPTLAGLGYDVIRTPVLDTVVQTNVSGKEFRYANQIYPVYRWELTYNILRTAAAYTEFQQLLGFFNARLGRFDSFLFTDPDDNTVTGQQIGVGDGSTTTFQLVRTLGGFVEPVLAPHTVSHVYDNGSDSGGWSASNWGTATPGLITYLVAPANGHAITADFSYYWPVRFDMDTAAFNNFASGMYGLKKLTLTSVKS